MDRSWCDGLALAMAALVASPVHAQSGQEPTVSVVPDTDGAGGRVDAKIRIAAPPADVWRAMLDCKVSERIVSGLTYCRVLKQDPNGAWDVREHRVTWSSLFPSVRNVFRSDYERHAVIRFARIEGDLRKLKGTWRLQPLAGEKATLVTYMAEIDPGVPVPGVLLRAAIESDVRKVLVALQREVENGR